MRQAALWPGIFLAGAVVSGCSIVAPQYSASIENVQVLKDSGSQGAKAGAFSQDSRVGNSISLRASSMTSPYNNYGNYLAEAIKQELQIAGKLSLGTNIEVSGMLLKNSIDISGLGTGYGDMEARFVVKKGESVRYDQVKKAHTEFDSSFAGGIAIPRGRDEYPRLVQRLLGILYADQSFIEALK
jgi:hypothetical protein